MGYVDASGQPVAGAPIINGVTGAAVPALAIVVNDGGAFFNGSGTTDNGKISGNSLKAQVFILIHELAHANSVPKFASDANSLAAGAANNQMIEDHCS